MYSLNDLSEFITVTDKGLLEEVEEGDYDGLVECMGHLIAVKERQATTDEMFEPLKQTIELLRHYGQELPDEVHMQLQVYCVYCNLTHSHNIDFEGKFHRDYFIKIIIIWPIEHGIL